MNINQLLTMIGSIYSSLSSGASRLYERINVKKAAVAAFATGAGVYSARSIAAAVLACVNPEPVCSGLFSTYCQIPETFCTPSLNFLKENGGVIGTAFVALLMSLQYLNNRTLQRRIQTLEARAGLNLPEPAGTVPPPPPVPAAPLAPAPPAPAVLSTPAAPPKTATAAPQPKSTSTGSSSAASAQPMTHQQALAAAMAARALKLQGKPPEAPKPKNEGGDPLAVSLLKARDALSGMTLPTDSVYDTRSQRKYSPPPAPAQPPKSPTLSSRSSPSPAPSDLELTERKVTPSPEPVQATNTGLKNAMAFWKARERKPQ